MSKIRGFTLIELMVVIAIVAILATFAVPAFTDQLRKSRRADAARGLSEIQLRQERWRASHQEYVGSDTDATEKALFGDLPVSPYYTFAFDSTALADGFTVSATPKAAQAADTGCSPMKLQVDKGVVIKTPTTNRCWN